MSRYGRRIVHDFVPDFVRAGMVTVSGLALGIDAEVAEQTIKARGNTVAVLGHGLSRIYPQGNRTLGEEIVTGGGLLLSEFPMFQEPERYMFPSRNRIIAGLSLATVVLEAPEGSGALITADLELDYNRDVFIVPGPIFDANYRGSNAFIAKGQGKLVQSATEVMEEMGVIVRDAPRESWYEPRTADETALWTALTPMPQSVEDLAEKSGLDHAALAATLTMMELQGAAEQAGGGMWIRR
jgi:DNA processing protein